MTDEELKAIEERANAATPGPWKWLPTRGALVVADSPGHGEHILWPDNVPGAGPDDEDFRPWASALGACGLKAEPDAEANAAFLASAREDVPALVAELRATRRLAKVAFDAAVDEHDISEADRRALVERVGEPS